MENFKLAYAKALYLRFCAMYGDKFVKTYHDEDFKSLWASEWSSGMAGIDTSLIKGALEFCKINLEWPPSIVEFRRICEKASGIPIPDEALTLAIRREFNHPVIKLAYDKVGSWAMKNDKESELKTKFNLAYIDALNHFRQNQEQSWVQLEEFNAAPPMLEEPPKIPSNKQIIGWKKRMEIFQQLAKETKENAEIPKHPEWDKKR